MKLKTLLKTAFAALMLITGITTGFAQTNIIPTRIEVANYTSWTDVDIAGTTYLQLSKATSSTTTPAMDFTTTKGETLNFKARTFGGTTGNSAQITVSVSINNGTDWTVITTVTPANSTITAVTPIDLSSYSGTQVKVKFETLSATGGKGAGIDDIAITTDETAPVATIVPANAATGVAINSSITITFNEAIRNIDNSEITNANVATLLGLKEKVSGNTVTFTATIDANKKVITITTPTANLSNSTEYEVSIAAVEDVADNAGQALTSTFTTIGSTTPIITLTAPNGGEKFYAGQVVNFTWTSANMDAENIKIEAYVYNNGSATWSWTECIASTANDGTEPFTIPVDAAYGNQCKVRITGLTSNTADESNATFTIIATTDKLSTLFNLPANSFVKYIGKATITYTQTYRNQKFIQDATGAVLLDDQSAAPGFITGTYGIGDGISNIEGKITLYNGLTEIVPLATTGEKVTGNPTITPEVKTMAELTIADQSKLITVKNVLFTNIQTVSATGNFETGKNYEINDGTTRDTVYFFRTNFFDANYIGTAIPTVAKDITAILLVYKKNASTKTVMQIAAISTDGIKTEVETNDAVSTKVYPNPFTTDFEINAGKVVRYVTVSNMLGQKVMGSAYNEAKITVAASDLKTGVYIVTVKFEDGTSTALRMAKK